MSLNIVLFEPEIPANTGNIARTCAATKTKLHLIRPLGFSTANKELKRAGLDYWQHVTVVYYDSLTEFFNQNKQALCYFITKFGKQLYTDMKINSTSDIFFIFGKETTGLPKDVLAANSTRTLRVPMYCEHVRSLNLANVAALVIYEALRNLAFLDLT